MDSKAAAAYLPNTNTVKVKLNIETSSSLALLVGLKCWYTKRTELKCLGFLVCPKNAQIGSNTATAQREKERAERMEEMLPLSVAKLGDGYV